MNAQRYLTLFCSVLLASGWIGCNGNGSVAFPLIKTSGIYDLKPTGYKVSVQVRDTLVNITILDPKGIRVETYNEASDIQKWTLFWEEPAQRLWLVSSDVGSSVWDFSGGGPPIKWPIALDADLIKAMPNEIYSGLSDGVKQQWNNHRMDLNLR